MFGEISPKIKNFSGSGQIITGSVLFGGANGAAYQDIPHFFWDSTNHSLYVGCNKSSQTFQSPGVLNLYGTDFTVNNSLNFYTTADGYAGLYMFHDQHGNQSLAFDASFNGSSWISSYSGSNYCLSHLSNSLLFQYNSGVSQGSTMTWNTGFSLNTSGQVNIPGLTASGLVATDSSKNLTSSVSGLSPTFTGLTLSGNLIFSTATTGLQLTHAAVSGGTANSVLVTGVVLTAGASGAINNSAITASHIGFAVPTTRSGTLAGGYAVTCSAGGFSVAGGALDNSTLAVLFIKSL